MKSAQPLVYIVVAIIASSQSLAVADEYLNGIKWEPPAIISVGENGVPSDAVVLFDGQDLSAWANVGCAANWGFESWICPPIPWNCPKATARWCAS